jgi:hypothetical protein
LIKARQDNLFPERRRPLATTIFDTIMTSIAILKGSNNILKPFQGDGRMLTQEQRIRRLGIRNPPRATKIAKVGEI